LMNDPAPYFSLDKTLGKNKHAGENIAASKKPRIARSRVYNLKPLGLCTSLSGSSSKENLLRRSVPHRTALTFLLLFLARKKVKKETFDRTF
jgi:hypothetical protein